MLICWTNLKALLKNHRVIAGAALCLHCMHNAKAAFSVCSFNGVFLAPLSSVLPSNADLESALCMSSSSLGPSGCTLASCKRGQVHMKPC